MENEPKDEAKDEVKDEPLPPNARAQLCMQELRALLQRYRCGIIPTRTVGAGIDELGWRLGVEP